MLCGQCLLLGYCRRLRSYKVTETEIDTRQFVLNLKRHARDRNVSFGAWLDYLSQLYGDYPGRIVDPQGRETMLDMSVFEKPSIKYWFRDFIGKAPAPIMFDHLRTESRPRVIILGTVLRAWQPVKASLWGKRIANDYLPLPAPANDNDGEYCPYWWKIFE